MMSFHQSMSDNEHWNSHQPVPCFNFTRPFKYSSHEFIIANSSKFKDIPFIIYKFDCKRNTWSKFHIKHSSKEDPANLMIFLEHNLVNIQSISANTDIMDHHGSNNVAFDYQTKKFYAVGLDWQLWEVDLSTNPGTQAIRDASDDSPSTWEFHGVDQDHFHLRCTKSPSECYGLQIRVQGQGL